MENDKFILPAHYVDTKRKSVVVYTPYNHLFFYYKEFLDMYPDYGIFVVWSKRFMKEIILLLEHDIDPFVGANTLSDMALAHIYSHHKPLLTSFPIEIDGKLYLKLVFKEDLSIETLPFNQDLYDLFYKEYHDLFNRKGFIVFGPESNRTNAMRHKFLDDKKLWPQY